MEALFESQIFQDRLQGFMSDKQRRIGRVEHTHMLPARKRDGHRRAPFKVAALVRTEVKVRHRNLCAVYDPREPFVKQAVNVFEAGHGGNFCLECNLLIWRHFTISFPERIQWNRSDFPHQLATAFFVGPRLLKCLKVLAKLMYRRSWWHIGEDIDPDK